MMKNEKILVTGACGPFAAALCAALRERYGAGRVIATDIPGNCAGGVLPLDVLRQGELDNFIYAEGVGEVYHLAGSFPAEGDLDAERAWKLNVHSLLSVLEIAGDGRLSKVFWPSSVSVFGPAAPRYHCPQNGRTEPVTAYGISKRAGEYWCNFYAERFGVDVRSLRFPGLVSPLALPEGEFAGFASEMMHAALEREAYTCFLEEDSCLPMVYEPDAVRAVLALMDAPKEDIRVRTAYNLAGMSFAPCDLAALVGKLVPGFRVAYRPDFRQAAADSWPASVKDPEAVRDWGWAPKFGLKEMAIDMLERLSVEKRLPLPEKEPGMLNYPDFVHEA